MAADVTIDPRPEDALAYLGRLLSDDIEACNRTIVARMASPVALIPQLAAHIVAAGGKRLRPLLTLACAKLCGYAGERHIRLAACVEFIHTATLLHDDVVDESQLRRGLASANAIFGNKASVLVGDFLFARAFQLMVEDGSLQVLEILSRAAATIAQGEVLQILLIAILFGLALASFEKGKPVLEGFQYIGQILFKMIGFIMYLAPLGAFGAMAFTIGRYGIKTLESMASLMLCFYATSAVFVFGVLGAIARLYGFRVWRLLKYLKEELLIVLGTSTSEAALPSLMVKLEKLGCAKSVVGLVVPSGYSFNLDGTSIYLTIAALFVAQATNTHMSAAQEIQLLLVLMLTSKGAAAVTGGGFITLAATLSSLHTVPVAGITLLLGVDRFMSEMRSLTNITGNAVATIVVAKWEGEFDSSKAAIVQASAEEAPALAVSGQ